MGKMFDSVGATNDQNDGDEEKKDSTEDGDETKPEGEESTKDVSISEENDDSREYSLPYDWKKLARRSGQSSQGNKTWDIYIIAPCGKKLRSNPEIEKYMSENPDVQIEK